MLARQISTLLSQEDSVIVPDLGRFYSKYEGSNLKGSELLPPSRVVMFDNYPKTDPTDKLKKYVQQEENLSDEIWEEKLKAFVKGIEVEVNQNGNYGLVTLGTFTKGTGGDLEFKSVNSLNQSPDSFGLPPLSLKPVVSSKRNEVTPPQSASAPTPAPDTEAKAKTEAVEEPAAYTQDDLKKKKKRSNNSLITWGVTIPLVFFLVFLLWLFFKSSSRPNVRDKDITKVEKPLEELPEQLPEETTHIEETTTTPPVEETEEVVETQPEETELSEEQAREAVIHETPKAEEPVADDAGKLYKSTGKYYVVLGAFRQDAKAQELRQQLAAQGRSAYLIPHPTKELVRVGVGAYETKKAAMNAVAELSQGWVMKW